MDSTLNLNLYYFGLGILNISEFVGLVAVYLNNSVGLGSADFLCFLNEGFEYLVELHCV